MSRMEQDQFINDRYAAIEDRLKVGQGGHPALLPPPPPAAANLSHHCTAAARPAPAVCRLCAAA